jgi:undecaprenyl-diphosphatase
MELKNISNKIIKWDQRIILKYNGFGGKSLTFFLKFISFFGRETIWLLLMWYYCFIWYDPFIFSYITTVFVIGLIIIAPVKKLVERERPFEKMESIKVLEPKPTSRSFPSWHAYNVTSQGLLVGYLLNSMIITILAIVFTLLVAFSRIQLGVHYPIDVIVGFILGIIGFVISSLIFAPIFMDLIKIIEMLIEIEIYYRIFNTYLIQNIWYLLLCIIILILIFGIATYKKIIKIIIKS